MAAQLGFDLEWDAEAGVGNDIAAFEMGDGQPRGRNNDGIKRTVSLNVMRIFCLLGTYGTGTF
jgi:hypothetical protein